MTDRQRQSLGGLCVAIALAVVGLVLLGAGADSDLTGVTFAAAGVVAVLCLLALGRDLIGPRD